jgi:hypothetical protein
MRSVPRACSEQALETLMSSIQPLPWPHLLASAVASVLRVTLLSPGRFFQFSPREGEFSLTGKGLSASWRHVGPDGPPPSLARWPTQFTHRGNVRLSRHLRQIRVEKKNRARLATWTRCCFFHVHSL